MDEHRTRHLPASIQIVIALLLSIICCAGTCMPAYARSTAVPAPLAQAGEYAENIYDAGKAMNYPSAQRTYKKLQSAVKQIGTQVGDQASNKRELAVRVGALGPAIKSKQRRTVLETSNRITYIVAQMTSPYSPKVPVEVTELDYYGRELEIWSAAKDTSRLQQAAQGMRTSWQRVRPQVISRGGTAQAKKFDSLMSSLGKAKTPAQYGRLATPILDYVDVLEGVFSK